MQKTLSYRHSFPPSSRRFNSQHGSLVASPSSPVFDEDEDDDDNHHAVVINIDGDIETPTAAATPGVVDPGTTSSTTPSSRFSENEQILPSDPRLVSAIVASPSSSSSTDHRPLQQQRYHHQHRRRIEPFVSPLTEANLKYHTSSYQNTREARNAYIEAYVETQADVIQLENELQRRRRAEIRSLVPLDTLSLTDEVIVQQPVIRPTTENLTTTLADHSHNDNYANNNNNNSDNNHHNNNNSNSNSNNSNNNKKKRRKWFRWLTPSSVRFKRKQDEQEEQGPEQQQHQQQQIPASSAIVGEDEGTPINELLDNDPLQQQRYSPTSPIATTTVSATTTSPPPPNTSHNLQRNSWAAPETSYQQYQNEKLELLHEGLCGLNNINILRALGDHGRAVVTGKGTNAASMVILPSQQPPQQEIKRDSGVSFSTQQQNNNNKNRRRFSVRLRSVREQDEQEQQQQQDQLSNSSTLIGFRYPRMVHRQTLRDAAIHVLSSELSLWENEDHFNDDGYDDEMEDNDDEASHYQGQHHIIRRRTDYARQQQRYYPPRNKRFSDPGMMFVP